MVNILLHIAKMFFCFIRFLRGHQPVQFLQLFTWKSVVCCTINLHPFLCLERKQDYFNPGKTYVREPARCLCCLSNPLQECGSAKMTGSLPHTWATTPHPPLSCITPTTHLCLSLTPTPHHPLQGPWIPAVTQELPPLLSAFFSSRSESRTSLGPNPGGQGGLLYRSYCFHEIGIWSILLMHKTSLFYT